LAAAAQQHQVTLRDDSRLQKAYLSGGLEYLTEITQGRVTTLEQLCQEAALMTFAIDQLGFFQHVRHWQPFAEKERVKQQLLQRYRDRHPELHPLVRARLQELAIAT
jgi:hypothetical protein